MTERTPRQRAFDADNVARKAALKCPKGGPDHQPGAVGRKTCALCDYEED